MADLPTIPNRPVPAADPDATLPPGFRPAPAAIDPTRVAGHAAAATGGGGNLHLPGYAVVGELARGGMGRVLAATDLAFGRQVAVKVLLPSPDPAGAAARFLREARVTAQLQHPGIPPVHHLGTHPDGSPFLVMKLVRGRTLDEELRHRATPAADLPRFVGVFEQVCQAVGYAHGQGVIHRDIKPGNVMVGAFGEVQVMDWGLALVTAEGEPVPDDPDPAPRRPGGGPEPSTLTHAGTILGTPAYMAPEQARGEDLDPRADVFALGGLLAAVLVGRTTFTGEDLQTTLTRAAAGDTTGVLAALDGCPADPELVGIARRCLAADRADRPADGTAVAALVAAYRAGVEARLRAAERDRAAAETQATEQRKRRKVEVALLAAVGLMAVGGWWHDRQEARRDKLEQEAAAAAFREQAEADRRAQADRDRADRAADAVANLLDRAAAALAAGDADRAAPFLDQADRRAADDRVAAHADRRAAYRADLAALRAFDRTDAFVWTPVGGRLPPAGAVRDRLAAAFADLDIVPGTTPPADAAGRVRSSPARDLLVARLDGWLARDPRPDLLALLRAADPDPFRDEVRAAVAARDEAALAALADRPEWAKQGSGVVRAFALLDAVPAVARRSLLARAVRAAPADFGLLMDLGIDCGRRGPGRDLDAAVRYFQAAVAARPTGLPAHYNLGTALADRGDAAAAEASFRDALALDPADARTLTNLGTALAARNDLAGAEKLYREAIAHDPDLANAHTNLGVLLRRRNDPAGAEASFRTAAGLDPADPRPLTNLAGLRLAAGDEAGAADLLRAATRADPRDVLAHFNLGVVLGRLSDPAGAAACFRAVVRLDPGRAMGHYLLGNALAQTGDLEAAVECFRQAVRLDRGSKLFRSVLAEAVRRQAALPVAPPPRPVGDR
jgi:Flp pilus assembly protein TadD